MPTTTRWGLPTPILSDAALVPTDMQELADAIAAVMVGITQGTFATRPAGVLGHFYRQTDAANGYPVGTVYFHNGTGWEVWYPKDDVAGTASLRTIGTGAQQAAAGNDSRFFSTGMMIDFAGVEAQIPATWFPCDGRAITAAMSTSLRNFLIAAGSPYGVVGSDPRVPDYRGRVGVGLDNMGGSDAGRLAAANTLGGTGGAELHTLVSGEIPSHSHGVTINSATTAVTATTVSSGAHTHTVNGNTGVTSSDGSHAHTAGTVAAGGHSHSGSADSAGSHSHGFGSGLGPWTGAGTGGTAGFTSGTNRFSVSSINADGAHTHSLSINGVGDHTHSVTVDPAGTHNHTVTIDSGGAHTHSVTITDPGHIHTGTIGNTGGGGSHNNMQPYVLINKIIKA